MPVVNMHEAKTHLAELIRRVQQGETFVIARAGRPMAQLIRLGASPLPRRPGSLAGVVKMDDEVGMPPAAGMAPAFRVPRAGGMDSALTTPRAAGTTSAFRTPPAAGMRLGVDDAPRGPDGLGVQDAPSGRGCAMNEWLLDTGVLLWWLAADPRLSFIVRTRITQAATRVFVSVATAWEVASLARAGRVDSGSPPKLCLPREVAIHRFLWLPLEARHVLRASAMRRDALDPYDRLLVAQAALEGLSIVTTDRRLGSHGVSIVDAMETPRLLAARRPRQPPGKPIRIDRRYDQEPSEVRGLATVTVRTPARPARRSGDELEGEDFADPMEPRTVASLAGSPKEDTEAVNTQVGGSAARDTGAMKPYDTSGVEACDTSAVETCVMTGAVEACDTSAVEPCDTSAVEACDTGAVEACDTSAVEPCDTGAVEACDTGADVGPGPECAPDIVVSRSIPRWNAFPWGGTLQVQPQAGPRARTRVMPCAETRVKPRLDLRVEPPVERRVDPRVEPRAERRVDPRVEPRVERRVDPRVETHAEHRVAPRIEPRGEPHADPRVERGVERRVHPGVERRIEPPVDRDP